MPWPAGPAGFLRRGPDCLSPPRAPRLQVAPRARGSFQGSWFRPQTPEFWGTLRPRQGAWGQGLRLHPAAPRPPVSPHRSAVPPPVPLEFLAAPSGARAAGPPCLPLTQAQWPGPSPTASRGARRPPGCPHLREPTPPGPVSVRVRVRLGQAAPRPPTSPRQSCFVYPIPGAAARQPAGAFRAGGEPRQSRGRWRWRRRGRGRRGRLGESGAPAGSAIEAPPPLGACPGQAASGSGCVCIPSPPPPATACPGSPATQPGPPGQQGGRQPACEASGPRSQAGGRGQRRAVGIPPPEATDPSSLLPDPRMAGHLPMAHGSCVPSPLGSLGLAWLSPRLVSGVEGCPCGFPLPRGSWVSQSCPSSQESHVSHTQGLFLEDPYVREDRPGSLGGAGTVRLPGL